MILENRKKIRSAGRVAQSPRLAQYAEMRVGAPHAVRRKGIAFRIRRRSFKWAQRTPQKRDWESFRLLGSVVVADRTVNAVALGSNPSLAAIVRYRSKDDHETVNLDPSGRRGSIP